MNWQSVNEGIITGISASLVIATALLLRDSIRDALLKRKITKNCKHLTWGNGLTGAHLGVTNYTGLALIVRGMSLVTDTNEIKLSPTNEITPASPKKKEKLSKEQKKKLKAGEHVLISSAISFGRPWKTEMHPSGFVQVTPFTSCQWLLAPEINPTPDTQFLKVRMEVEYVSRKGKTTILTIEAEEGLDPFKKITDSLHEQLKSGTFNLGRKRFNLPPIPGYPT